MWKPSHSTHGTRKKHPRKNNSYLTREMSAYTPLSYTTRIRGGKKGGKKGGKEGEGKRIKGE